MNELNHKDVIRALECCLSDKSACEQCPVKEECLSHPFEAVLAKYSLTLLREKDARIEELEAELKEWRR